jgi:hypothetical protein
LLTSHFNRSPPVVSNALESEDFLKGLTTTNLLVPIDYLSTEFNAPPPDGYVNIVHRRTRELPKIKCLHRCLALTAHTPLAASRHTAVHTCLFEYGTSDTFVSFYWSGFALDPENWYARFIRQRFPTHTGKRQESLARLYQLECSSMIVVLRWKHSFQRRVIFLHFCLHGNPVLPRILPLWTTSAN